LTRFALLGEILAPFRVPLFDALAARDDVEFLAVFLAHTDPRRTHYRVDRDAARFRSVVLSGRSFRRGGRWLVVNRGVGRTLRRFRPDVVGVGGWNQPAFWRALAYTRAHRIPLVVWVESTERDARSEAKPLAAARRAMVRSAAGFFVPGEASRAYVCTLGVDDARVVIAPNAVDAAAYGAAAVDRSGRERATFVYIGRLDPEKGLDVLLDAWDGVRGELVIAGAGSDEQRLRARSPAHVRFVGAVTQEETVALYRDADVFVLPSRSEPWGMVLNEAAAAGLPLVATDGVGAAYDLLRDGENGFRVPVGDVDALREALRTLAGDADLRRRQGERSRELAARFTPEAWAAGVAQLLRLVA
jgi:glycosyltransferase involved in cell wall biosynthesis